MEKRSIYTAPEMDIIILRQEEVITTSGSTETYQKGSTGGWFSNGNQNE